LPAHERPLQLTADIDICRLQGAGLLLCQPASCPALRLRGRHAGDAVLSAWSTLYPCGVQSFWGCGAECGAQLMGDGRKSAVLRNVYKQKPSGDSGSGSNP